MCHIVGSNIWEDATENSAMLGMFEAVSCLPVPAGPQLLDGGEVNIDTDQLSTRRHPQLVGKTKAQCGGRQKYGGLRTAVLTLRLVVD